MPVPRLTGRPPVRAQFYALPGARHMVLLHLIMLWMMDALQDVFQTVD